MRLVNYFIVIFISFLVSSPLSAATIFVELHDLGTGVKTISTGLLLSSGNLSVSIYDSASGGNLVYSENFTDAINNGAWSVTLGENSSNPLYLEFNRKYYKDYLVNNEDVNFTFNNGTASDRKAFYSTLGELGRGSNASGLYSAAFGNSTYAGGLASFAAGYYSQSSGQYSASFGNESNSSGFSSFSCGSKTNAIGNYSISQGHMTSAEGVYSVSFGNGTYAGGLASFAAGSSSNASGSFSTALGYRTKATEQYAAAFGHSTNASGIFSFAAGYGSTARGESSISMGFLSDAGGDYSVSMGHSTNSSGFYSFAAGRSSKAIGDKSIALGESALASGEFSTAIGYQVNSNAAYSFSWGGDSCSSLNVDCVNNQQGVFAVFGGLCVANSSTSCPDIADGVAYINDALLLNPKGSAPDIVSEGMIYYSSNARKPCYYNGSAWLLFNESACF